MTIIDPVDVFKAHQSAAGRSGGRSRSAAKVAAARLNLAKVRQRRHNPVTGPQVGENVPTSSPKTTNQPSPQPSKG